MLIGYVWTDANDPHSSPRPILGYGDPLGADIVYANKRIATEAYSEYVETEGAFNWKPKLKLWKIEATKVVTK